MRNTLIALTASISLASGCSREAPATHSSADTGHVLGAKVPDVQGNRSPVIVGDTFVLVAIGAQSTRVPVSDSAPCGLLPFLRLVIASESTFYRVTDDRPTCYGPATDSASWWTGEWSTYRVDGDTLHLFQGDGDERFYWVSGILSDDSLIQVFGDKPFRFARIRPRSGSERR